MSICIAVRSVPYCLVGLLVWGGCGKTKSTPGAPPDAGGAAADVGGAPTPDDAGGADIATADVVADGGGAPDLISAAGCPQVPTARPAGTPTWSVIGGLHSAPAWYATPAAAYVAESILSYQNLSGGWPKNIDMTYRPGIDAGATPRDLKSMIDNDATTTQIKYLAYMLGSWPRCERYSDAFNAGMAYLFNAQYPSNGGWPQVWPDPTGYSRFITYNDNAMVHVMQIMRDIAYQAPLFSFVSIDTAARARTALSKGVDCMLKTQIKVGGKKTGWCAQHDEITLLPAKARAYELPSMSGKEGVQVLAFLMTLDLSAADVPKAEIVETVEAAVLFYESLKITGTRYVQANNEAGMADSWIEMVPNAVPLWARFYDLEAPFKPFFCDRDGVKVYSLSEVGVERRGGYAWYVTDGNSVLHTSYPAWVIRWQLGRNVLDSAAAPVDGGGSVDGNVGSEGG